MNITSSTDLKLTAAYQPSGDKAIDITLKSSEKGQIDLVVWPRQSFDRLILRDAATKDIRGLAECLIEMTREFDEKERKLKENQ